MKKFGLSMIVLLIILLGFNNTDAQRDKRKMRNHKLGLKQLNLTEQQKEKMKEIKFNLAETNIETEAKIKKNKLEIKKLLSNKNFDEKKLMSLIEKNGDLKLALKKSNVKMWLDVRNILDENQKIIWLKHFNQLDKQRNKIQREGKRKFNKLKHDTGNNS